MTREEISDRCRVCRNREGAMLYRGKWICNRCWDRLGSNVDKLRRVLKLKPQTAKEDA